MNLEELLAYTSSDLLDDRTTLLDGESDSLYSDASLVALFNEAQRILARRAWCIIEYGVPPAGVIVLSAGKVLYPLHKSVLRIFDATPSTQTAPLGRTNDINLRNPYPPSADAFDIGESAAIAGTTLNIPGAALAIATDAGTRMLRVAPEPAAAQANLRVDLKIARLPVTWLSLEDMEAEPEVPSDYHLAMCTYAAGKCLTRPQVDSNDKVTGREMLAEFDAIVREARRDRQRAEYNGDRWTFASTTAEIK